MNGKDIDTISDYMDDETRVSPSDRERRVAFSADKIILRLDLGLVVACRA